MTHRGGCYSEFLRFAEVLLEDYRVESHVRVKPVIDSIAASEWFCS